MKKISLTILSLCFYLTYAQAQNSPYIQHLESYNPTGPRSGYDFKSLSSRSTASLKADSTFRSNNIRKIGDTELYHRHQHAFRGSFNNGRVDQLIKSGHVAQQEASHPDSVYTKTGRWQHETQKFDAINKELRRRKNNQQQPPRSNSRRTSTVSADTTRTTIRRNW